MLAQEGHGAEIVQREEEEPEGVPRVSLDYFFLGESRKVSLKKAVGQMTTKELRRTLKTAQLPANGSRGEMERVESW